MTPPKEETPIVDEEGEDTEGGQVTLEEAEADIADGGSAEAE
jgi:hypothetical protein